MAARDKQAETSPLTNAGNPSLTAAGDREIVMTRVFDAPRRLVFDALTKPELVRRWLLGPSGWSMPVCEIDLKAGGTYRYVWRHAGGREMGVRGVYREVVPPQRVVHTESFDDPWYPAPMESGVAESYDRLAELLASAEGMERGARKS